MFTQEQINQLQGLFQANNETIKQMVREEIGFESQKIRLEMHNLDVRLDNLESEIKDLKIEFHKLEKGQEELREGQTSLKKEFGELRKGYEKLTLEVQSHTKTLNYIKKKLNKTANTVDVIGRMFDKDILKDRKRIDRIEHIFGL